MHHVTLSKGSHNPDEPDACLFEHYNLARIGVKTDDCPEHVSPVLHRFGMRLNDALPDDKRQLLAVYVPEAGQVSPLHGTAGDGLDEVRRHMAVDWSVRVATPLWLDAAGRTEIAAELRGLAPITDKAGRDAIRPRLRAIADECWEARRAALKQIRERSADADAAADAAAAAAAVAAAAADAAAAAVAAAAADAVAAAAADAAAVAVAAAAADAVAAAAADAAADYSKTWRATYNRVYAETKAHILATYEPIADQVHDSAIELFAAMVKPAQG